ncbi:MAG: preprotein translocase subunit SecA [Candidatus Taylorbacteria bacterium RIFCSPLOWO2_12_FULL_43_20]|uniref:Protein translocase subunit SecA n=1 Tax=Candidatus Taylorbacteria bacterium RIFCSPLOWO2_12_FULL_43_20 TaxID=1802332 RepID=A0A1G2P399_9BACT|nr:MAG: preprotein translocase subunit SecA [Candidatus Taylorbacteria bacterium RIFCSPHIGHO2_01_FULL_43_120]OHA31223.1 MAG: preprotein translocase subunit SecA [Candidatus Taylorbacteria bacterium RIFCSPLOWO2_01_FULL_43_83]OHA38724.1 MAG: preprotein translocase subunit SecA [Candidatus Taylorbacteria bacterium RIFCSPLOWO2_02_FULL_43_22b]OHA42810.1 MAG: preprotein translocase subunit SecA [Candidatus Taylorbacteria bacterium RIFCSPLOWO2_12_FULL_43_20]
MNFLKKILGDENAKTLKALEPNVAKINSLEPEMKVLSGEQVKAKTAELKKRISNGAKLDDILPEAFALVREASVRTLGQRHFDVQLLGGMILHHRGIAEMRTGEGKTLVATLPAYLNALEGKGVHIVTVNDYLSRRDAVWMGQIYDYLGLSVGVLNHESSFLYDTKHISLNSKHEIPNPKNDEGEEKEEDKLDMERDETGAFHVVHEFLRPVTRREAYLADVTYGTNNEYGFDYLRDNIEYDTSTLRQRNYHYAIVDEIDSILIDEARTPLIISAPAQDSENLYAVFAGIASRMNKDEDYTVDEKFKAITLTDIGIEKAEKILGVDNIYTEKGIKYVHHLETAVRAKALFEKNKEYVVKDGEVVIVDEFTGRLQPGRRWSEGLHQAIEAKEGVAVQRESRTYASITFQNYFRLYSKLAGMTGTAVTSKEEFYKVYGLDTVAVPTNKPIARRDHNDLIFQSEKGKFKAIARKVRQLNEQGQPVLIGTVSIDNNELLSQYLSNEGIKHELLNAKNHEREGELIAQAGRYKGVTVATNIAGRGVDIKLGGNPATEEEYARVRDLGGLFVLGTERHEARRIDNQLRGRSGRQGDPGETQFFVSLEDSLMRVFASDMIKKMMGRLGVAEDEPIENSMITKSLETAQTKIEGFHFDSRKHVLEFDDVLNIQRKAIYERRRKILMGDKADLETYIADVLGSDEDLKRQVDEREKVVGNEEFYNAARRLFLQTIDMYWVDHLEMMDYMRGSVNLRAYGQRDPLVEYKKEGLKMFKDMQESINGQIREMLPKIGAGAFKKEEEELKKTQENMRLIGASKTSDDKPKPVVAKEEVGRNDPCPCGSGKKYKKCHGA